MTVALTADAPSTAARRRGRHRVGTPSGVRCTDLPAVRERMQFSRTPAEQRRHRALPRPDPAGQPDPQHGRTVTSTQAAVTDG